MLNKDSESPVLVRLAILEEKQTHEGCWLLFPWPIELRVSDNSLSWSFLSLLCVPRSCIMSQVVMLHIYSSPLCHSVIRLRCFEHS